MQHKITVLDTETTGMNGDIVELATVNMAEDPWLCKADLCKPNCDIEIEAMAIHHITPVMVANRASAKEVIQTHELDKADVWVAHNAEFDRRFIGKYISGKPWICTWRCASVIWPDAPGYSNQELRYWLGIDLPDFVGTSAHRAMYDAYTTALIFQKIAETKSVDELIAMTNSPILLKKVRFGKHRGGLWADVPTDYLKWVLKQGDMDADVKYTATQLINHPELRHSMSSNAKGE